MDEPKVAIVTGSASGIGLELTNALGGLGWRVFAADIDKRRLLERSAEFGWEKIGVEARELDVRDGADWRRLVDEAVARWGRLDALFNVAGVVRPAWTRELSPDDVALQMDVNAKGVILGTAAAAAAMVPRRSGHIVNVASLAGVAPVEGIAVYSASKFAVRGFSLAAAIELREFGVAVTVVCPDAVDTPMLDLQVDFPSAAMTFSAPRFLTAKEVTAVIVTKVLRRRPVEVLIPWTRGRIAKLANMLPGRVAGWLSAVLIRRGRRLQADRQAKRDAGSKNR